MLLYLNSHVSFFGIIWVVSLLVNSRLVLKVSSEVLGFENHRILRRTVIDRFKVRVVLNSGSVFLFRRRLIRGEVLGP